MAIWRAHRAWYASLFPLLHYYLNLTHSDDRRRRDFHSV